ncbi:SAM-dependent methyltransferase [Nocardia sp. SYP-A9097]|uniref:SAM-dependent methyltransferase n=1 Tax=Nocardia sp. SYP-A9097 TaxID=2663237 RepID=UPI00129A3DD4|nr:SAM-dependent methyltransferase [Nocardia sp. SYP-A9097]MRH88781.1 SAM-dependent methyltransferase [Nocardia sp. SYP-A9097]
MVDDEHVNQAKPSIARVYDYLLGGQDNYAVDREVGDFFKNDLPGSVAIAFSNRHALVRAVEEMTRLGIRQFLDMGSGLPTADNVHQVAQRWIPDARVVYIDNDPIVLAHGRALLADEQTTMVIQADLHDPADIRKRPEVLRLIDFEQPVGVIFSATLHHLQDEEKPAEVVRFWNAEVAPGSMFYVSHFRSGDNAETKAAEEMLQTTFGRGRWRTDDEIRGLFGDLEILEPGLVPCGLWRTTAESGAVTRIGAGVHDMTVWEQLIACGMARKR